MEENQCSKLLTYEPGRTFLAKNRDVQNRNNNTNQTNKKQQQQNLRGILNLTITYNIF